jgi:hypothetical protein
VIGIIYHFVVVHHLTMGYEAWVIDVHLVILAKVQDWRGNYVGNPLWVISNHRLMGNSE